MFVGRSNWNLEENRLSRTLARRRGTGEPVIDLSASNPTTCGFSFDEAAILGVFADPGALRYSPDPRGLPVARAAVASYYAERASAISAEEIFLTTGTSEAYSFVFRTLCDPGDE